MTPTETAGVDTAGTQTFEFQTEARQLLDLMIHSVYSNKDIFLRELISNASDAIDKLRYEALTNTDLARFTSNPEIRLEPDPEGRFLTIHDSGIGMSREEVQRFIGTIAKSGTREFAKAIQEAKAADVPADDGQVDASYERVATQNFGQSADAGRYGHVIAWQWAKAEREYGAAR